tara:strand:- start:63 stop:656 length:594 start_codon:yes stop_codon:yes gene_type:complete
MNITRQQLKTLIQEEIKNVLSEQNKEQLDEGIGALLAFATVLFGGQVEKTDTGYNVTGEQTHQMVTVDGAEFQSPEQLAKALETSGLVKDSDADRGISNVQVQMTDADADYTGYDIDQIDGQGVSSYMGSLSKMQGDSGGDLMKDLASNNPNKIKKTVDKMTTEQAKELVSKPGFSDLDLVIQKAIKAKAGLMNPVR